MEPFAATCWATPHGRVGGTDGESRFLIVMTSRVVCLAVQCP